MDDAQPDLSSLLQGLPDGDAQGSLRVIGLTPLDDARVAWGLDCARFEQELMISEGSKKMLAEKFFLYLEALIKSQQNHADGSPKVISTSPRVPIKLPASK